MSSPLLWGPNNTSNNLQNQLLLANGTLISANGQKNYITNGTFANNATTGWSLGTATLTSNFPSGTPTFGSGANANLSIYVTNISIAGNYSLVYTSSTASTAGNFLASDAFTIDSEDQAKVLSFKFSYQVYAGTANMSGTSSNSFGVAIYDVTNSAWIQPAGVFNLVQSSGVGQSTGTFQTSSNGTSYRFVLYNANATSGAITMIFDSFSVGPQVTASGSAMSDEQLYTPTIGGFTATSPAFYWSRIGDKLRVRGYAGVSAVAASQLTISLPNGLVQASTVTAGSNLGRGFRSSTSSTNNFVILGNPSFNYVVVGLLSTAAVNPLTGQLANAIVSNGDLLIFEFTVPISGWSCNTVMSNDTDTRVVAARMRYSTLVSTVANTVIAFDTVDYDTTGSVSGGRFTAPVSGIYAISGTGRTGAGAATLNFQLFKNGSLDSYLANATAQLIVPLSGQIKLNAGDIIDLRPDNTAVIALEARFEINRISGPATIAATESVSMAYSNTSGQAIANNTGTTVTNWTKDFDSHNAFNSTTGIFTVPVSGKYQITGMVFYSPSGTNTAGAIFALTAVKAGSSSQSRTLGCVSTQTSGSSGRMYAGGSTLFNCLAGDTLSLTTFQNSGASQSLQTAASDNYITIERVGN